MGTEYQTRIRLINSAIRFTRESEHIAYRLDVGVYLFIYLLEVHVV